MMKHLMGGASPSAASKGNEGAPSGAGANETEQLDEREGNVLLSMISQLRPGMDLSRISFPTFVLEPRSMLERITDFLSHPDIIFGAGAIDDPNERYIKVLAYYLAGWHIKPKGVKKPYNPVLGEIFRCKYKYSDGSQGLYVAEQVSHHPPISAFYYCSPENKLVISGELRPKSKFLGNSVVNEMGGYNHCTLLDRPQDGEYDITMPNMYARGILFGKMVLELGDMVKVSNDNTNVHCDIEFKTKGFFSGSYNAISGKVRGPQGDLGEVSGKWSDQIFITRPKSNEKELLFDAHKAVAVKKIVAPESEQSEFESHRLWRKVTEAIKTNDQDAAQEHKAAIEERQREIARMREDSGEPFKPRYFTIRDGEYRPLFSLPADGSVEMQIGALESWIFGSSSTTASDAKKDEVGTEKQAGATMTESGNTTATALGTRPNNSTSKASDMESAAAVTASADTANPRRQTISKPVAIAGPTTSQMTNPASVPSSPETGVSGHLGHLFGRKHRKHANSSAQPGLSDDQASSRQLRSTSTSRND